LTKSDKSFIPDIKKRSETISRYPSGDQFLTRKNVFCENATNEDGVFCIFQQKDENAKRKKNPLDSY